MNGKTVTWNGKFGDVKKQQSGKLLLSLNSERTGKLFFATVSEEGKALVYSFRQGDLLIVHGILSLEHMPNTPSIENASVERVR